MEFLEFVKLIDETDRSRAVFLALILVAWQMLKNIPLLVGSGDLRTLKEQQSKIISELSYVRGRQDADQNWRDDITEAVKDVSDSVREIGDRLDSHIEKSKS